MKLVTWNCQGAFRKKAEAILELKPDILVIQECEHPDKLEFNSTVPKPNDIFWYSDGGKKGIGVFSYLDYKFELLPEFNPGYRYIIPINVKGNGQTFTIFAVWAMNDKENYDARYIGQVWLAINYYKDFLNDATILIGDFNSNKIWDYKGRVGNHTDVVSNLALKGIYSVYHKYFNFEHGEEKHPSFYLQRNKNKPYHIDYCFVSLELLKKVKKFEIGEYENWISFSDHVPLTINFDLSNKMGDR